MYKDINILKEKHRLNVERLLYVLVFTLIYEGLIRKLLPSALGIVIFFLKDILCIIGLLLVSKSFVRNNVHRNPMYNLRKVFLFLLIPPLIVTNFLDPILVVFAIKQYVLYMVVGLLVPLAFTPDKIERFKKFISFFALMVIPTTLIAMMQNALPDTHWLNLSVDGSSLGAFSAAGVLRVSSTFSFTGQYSWFLNIACVILVVRFCLPVKGTTPFKRKLSSVLPIIISICLIIGAFITGGRTAVLGCALALFLGFVFSVIKTPQRILIRGLGLMVLLGASLTVLRAVKPEYFLVYDLRSEDDKNQSHAEEIEGRVAGDMFNWVNWIGEKEALPFLFGSGLGVMSNGSERISAYAAQNHVYGIQTESEMDTIIWEGGMYFFIVFFGIRIWVIIRCLKFWREIKDGNNAIAVSFLLAYITIVSLYGMLSRQPPVSIWWWIAIGSVIVITNYDKSNYIASDKSR